MSDVFSCSSVSPLIPGVRIHFTYDTIIVICTTENEDTHTIEGSSDNKGKCHISSCIHLLDNLMSVPA
jgi:hypothetical protein